ncbi:MAG: helix-turn-helix domain-containing protein [Caldilineaceae bacterium]
MTAALRIGLQVRSLDPYWVEVRETIWRICRPPSLHTSLFHTVQKRQERLPPIELIDVDLGYHQDDEDGLVTVVEELLALELDALITVPDDLTLVEELLDHGLPVISLIHRELSHPFFTSPRELAESAYIACEFLAAQLAGRGRILIVGGRHCPGDPARSSSRVRAALDVFARHPDMTWHHLGAPWDYAGARAQLLAAGADLADGFDGVFGLSDTMALVAHEVGTREGWLAPDAMVVGINGDPLAIMAIADGSMTATVATSASGIAQRAVELACSAARGDHLPATFSYDPVLVTQDNVAQIALRKLGAIADLPSRLVGVNRQREEQRITQLEAGLAINRRLGSILDGDELQQEIADLIRTSYDYDHVQIFVWAEDERALILHQPGVPAAARTRVPLCDAAVLGHALLRNRATFIPDMARSQRFAPDPYWPATRARVVVPIRFGAATRGVIDLHSTTMRRVTNAELDSLQSLADQLGVAMRNAELYGEAVAARAEAEQANHLKTRLLANVSHELRTPLNVILGYSQAAMSDPNPYGQPLPDELRRDLRHIGNSGEHLVRLINDLLDLSQAQIGALEIVPEPVDLQTLLTDAFESIAHSQLSARTVDWRLELPAHLPTIVADPVRLRQVVLNLLSNAARFTEHGHIALGAAAGDEDVTIWVEDTGVGIDPDLQQKIVEVFMTASTADGADEMRPRAGIGLGLSVTHHLVQLHGGALQIDSRPGMGTTCRVCLPRGDADAPEQTSTVNPMRADRVPLDPLLDGVLQHGSDIVQCVADYIRENYAGHPTREEVAHSLGVSPNYVSRIFRRETGMTPWQYLTRYRVAQAQRLLADSNFNITEIASQVGITDPAYFSRVFHKETGQSPQQYRKSAG